MKAELRHRIPTEELRAAVAVILARHFGTSPRADAFHRRLSSYSSSAIIEYITMEAPPGRRVRLVLKDLSPAARLRTAHQVRPRFLYEPHREIETYRTALDSSRWHTPEYYGAVQQPELDRFWLFLERVDGPLLWQSGRIGDWEDAARWLAAVQSEMDDTTHPETRRRVAHLPRYTARYFKVWAERSEQRIAGGRCRSRDRLRRFGRLMDRYDRVIQRLLELPKTLIHGEFYPSNILLRQGLAHGRICPIDWEVAAIAPGLIDLAALTSGDWEEPVRRRMVEAYRDTLSPRRGWPPSLADLMESIDYCQLHLAVQWFGWSDEWSPPEPHARDWLGEILRLARKLDI